MKMKCITKVNEGFEECGLLQPLSTHSCPCPESDSVVEKAVAFDHD